MMIGIAVAALLLAAESVQAQNRGEVRRSERTERNERLRRDDRHIDQPDPRRSTRRPVAPIAPERPRIKVVDNEVIRSFERERYDSNRLKMADMIFSTGGFMTTSQIIRVSNYLDYDSNRVKFLMKAYFNCVDPHNFYMVLRTLDYSSSRDKVIRFVLDNVFSASPAAFSSNRMSSSLSVMILIIFRKPLSDPAGWRPRPGSP